MLLMLCIEINWQFYNRIKLEEKETNIVFKATDARFGASLQIGIYIEHCFVNKYSIHITVIM